MSLKRLFNQGRLKSHKTSREELANLFEVSRRDFKDARVTGLSADRSFAIAYNAVLQLATIPLYCSGFKTEGTGHHFTIFQSLKNTLGKEFTGLADYFDSCRSKRNITEYGYTGAISEKEAGELIKEGQRFLSFVERWLKDNYPDLA